MRLFQVLILFCCSLIEVCSSLRGTPHNIYKDDADKDVKEYVLSYGYRFEEHKIVTKDGYILGLWRIPCKQKTECGNRRPVLLQHGILDNGFSFLFQKIDKNLPMMLIEKGYDVWIGNARGTVYSMEHTDPKGHNPKNYSSAFWDFSWDEIGLIDIPTMVSYITKTTGYNKISYVCHSQGCTAMICLACQNISYVNSHFDAVTAIAPGMYGGRSYYSFGIDMFVLIGVGEKWLKTGMKNFIAQEAYRMMSAYIGKNFPRLWIFGVDIVAGIRRNPLIDMERVPVLAAHEPGGTSVFTYLHWQQQCYNETFRFYDFGKEGNIKKYGSEYAPVYNVENLSKTDFPWLIISGQRDSIATAKGMKMLKNRLKKGSYDHIDIPAANHLDVVWGDFLHRDIFPKIIAFFNKNHEYQY